jgi:protein TonB
MFEDSTFESNGIIHTRSRGWMVAAFAFNSSILLALIVIPLIFPQALPHQMIPFLMEAPVPPTAPQQSHQPAHAAQAVTDAQPVLFQAPRIIPKFLPMDDKPAGLPNIVIAGPGLDPGVPGSNGPILPGNTVHPIVRPERTGPLAVPSSIETGLLILKNVPRYPAIAVATRTEGTVVLAATISKAGAIENLRVVSGPAMLKEAALDAVKTWRYKPYLLDGQPVEVETTVNVVFSMSR